MNDVLVVGYYTKNTKYEDESKSLIKSLDKIGIEYDIPAVDDLGSWQLNTRYKAKFLLEMCKKHKDRRMLYVDCDAIVRKPLTFLDDFRCDIAVRWQDFSYRKHECLSGTIYFEPNENTINLFEKWISYNKRTKGDDKNLEQWNLGSLIERDKTINAKNLPPEYTFIFDTMRRIYPELEPVVEHFQASRKLRRNYK